MLRRSVFGALLAVALPLAIGGCSTPRVKERPLDLDLKSWTEQHAAVSTWHENPAWRRSMTCAESSDLCCTSSGFCCKQTRSDDPKCG